MKKIFTVTLLLFVAVISGCGASGENNKTTVNAFLDKYTSYKADENYYETHNLDYLFLYDTGTEKSKISETKDDGKKYSFVLVCSGYGDETAKMNVSVNQDEYVKSVDVELKDSVLNLFETPEQLSVYYATIITGINNNISLSEALDKVVDLWNEQGDTKTATIDGMVLRLELTGIDDEYIRFSVEVP